jgi:uncharacterized membrane protein
MKTLQELCLLPAISENFPQERLQRLEKALAEDRRTDMPWYLRVIVGFGAWLASLFFLGFACVLLDFNGEHQKQTLGCFGVVLLVVAIAFGRMRLGIFADQCCLAASLAGQAMLYFGFIDENHHPLETVALLSIGLAALLYFLFPNFLSRLLTCGAALQVTLLWIYTGNNGEPFSGVRLESTVSPISTLYWTLHLVVIGVCFLRPRHAVLLAPLGYACLLSLVAWQMENLFNLWSFTSTSGHRPDWIWWTTFHFRTALMAAAFLFVAGWAAGGMDSVGKNSMLFAALALALAVLVILGSGGVLLAMLVMLLGFATQHRAVLGLGIILLPVFLTHYYYNLNLDLLAKSGVLIGSGAVMFLIRAGLTHIVFADSKEAA